MTTYRFGEAGALERLLASLDERIRGLQAIMPGSEGGGSVRAPFKIGGYTIGGSDNDIDLATLARLCRGEWIRDYRTIVAQGAVTPDISYNIDLSEYRVLPQEIEWLFKISMAGTGTAVTIFTLLLPVASGYAGLGEWIGEGEFYDSNTATRYICGLENYPSPQHIMLVHDTSSNTALGAAPSIALGPGDAIRGRVRYRPIGS